MHVVRGLNACLTPRVLQSRPSRIYDESWDKSCRRTLPGRSPWEIPVAGTCDRERSQGGVSSWDEAPGWEVLFSTG